MNKAVVELDNRGLNPPEPMVRILDALKGLPAGGEVVAHNDREPLFLYPILQEQGYRYETTPVGDGTFQVRIWKGEPA